LLRAIQFAKDTSWSEQPTARMHSIEEDALFISLSGNSDIIQLTLGKSISIFAGRCIYVMKTSMFVASATKNSAVSVER
jgi:hypothetical protein